jgi:hypothetical protein
MDLTKCINEQLQKAPSEKTTEIQGVDGQLRVDLKLADCGRLGCLLDRFNLKHTKDGHLAFDPVHITEQVTYLGERLDVIENEGEKGRTILRSNPPRIDGENISYFEMVLDRSMGMSLARYEYDTRNGKRKAVAAPLTKDTLERLICDLIELVQEN